MALKTTTINFYQIQPKVAGGHTMKEISKELDEIRMKSSFNNMKVGSKGYMVMPKPLKDSDYLMGAIFFNQMSNIPGSMNLGKNNEINALPFDENTGLAKATCFLIEPKINLLVSESGTGVTEKGICQFLKFNSGLPIIEPAVIIDPGQVDKVWNMKSITGFEARIADISENYIAQDNAKGFDEIIEKADETNADKMVFRLEIDKENKKAKSLDIEKITGYVNKLIGARDVEKAPYGDGAKSIFVEGYIDDETKATKVELIKQRLYEKISYEVEDRLIKSYNIVERLKEIEAKYLLHRNKLLRTCRIED